VCIASLFLMFIRETGLEGGAVVNDTTVWCQSRGVTEPAGETKSRFSFSVFSVFISTNGCLTKKKIYAILNLPSIECERSYDDQKRSSYQSHF